MGGEVREYGQVEVEMSREAVLGSVYVPAAFGAMLDAEVVHMLGSAEMQLACMVTATPRGVFVSALPWMLRRESMTLEAHIARQNPHHAALREFPHCPSMVLFLGPHCYISPNYYHPQGQRNAVPTWDYMMVKFSGVCSLTEEEDTLQILEDLSRHNEEQVKAAVPGHEVWEMNKLSGNSLQRMLNSIQGLRLSIQDVVVKRKLTQNRGLLDMECTAQHLQAMEAHSRTPVSGVLSLMQTHIEYLRSQKSSVSPPL